MKLSGDLIRGVRKKVGISMVRAAKIVGVTQQAWYHWEHDERKMPVGLWELFLLKTGQKRLKRAVVNDK